MPCAIVVVGFENGMPCPIAGQYLKTFDFEAYGGQGYGTFTNDPAKAKQFPDKGAAMEFWRTQSRTRPFRSDGRPNRPLTASTVEIAEIGKHFTAGVKI